MHTASSEFGDQLAGAPASAAIRYLAEHGYETTTASELADAIGMSRSTFFRRFGSKEDVVFADHTIALERLEQLLADTQMQPTEAVTLGVIEVMHLLIRDTEAARLRSKLLRNTPSLRERELVLTHRYERVFAGYLTRTATPGTPAWAPIALAAGLVAVHNAALRRWLRHSEPRALSSLERELSELIARFSPWFGGEHHPSRVVVASFESGTSPDEVLRAIASQLS